MGHALRIIVGPLLKGAFPELPQRVVPGSDPFFLRDGAGAAINTTPEERSQVNSREFVHARGSA
jgi:hypothetical protein